MFIEELIIDGFKSYSTRTSVGPFDRQFNAITGLNGSGKSNILDSICFVLGISNLSQVRVGNLSELVYKQGQAGISKASVTVVFNNEDKSCGPVGYEAHDKITITRQIIIGGRNRYLLNSHNVQANQIQNLFHSVSLNVNNPHFLIMQGRITKVINMKPQETLSMIEEAAGTRMYENKKAIALKTLEKKQNKVDEINRLLSEEITPTLEKLQKERANYMLWVSNNNEIERLQRFCIAYEYVQVKSRLENKNQQLEEMEEKLGSLVAGVKALGDREVAINSEISERSATLNQQQSKDLKKLEEDQNKFSKDVASTESKLKNRESELQALLEGQKSGKSALAEQRKQVEQKDAVYQKEKAKFDSLNEADAAIRKQIENAQWSVQAVTAGMAAKSGPGEGEGKSMREQLLAAQTKLSEMEAEAKKKTMAISSFQERVAAAEQVLVKCKQEGKMLAKEKAKAEALIVQKRTDMEHFNFDRDGFTKLVDGARAGENQIHSMQDRLDSLRARLGGIDFSYSDPYRGFNRNSVKGVVAKLFHIQPQFAHYHRALEVSAGGRLFNVVVDNEETGKALLERGQLRRRVTIIPLSKISNHRASEGVVRQAKGLAASGDLHLALEIIGFEGDVQNAMRYVFGNCLVCDTPDTAKKVTFHPNVRTRTVTKDGDVYDPSGTITGGSAPRGGNILQQLQEVAELEKQLFKQKKEYEKNNHAMSKMQAAAAQFAGLERELRCKEHELANIEDRINRSEHHAAEQAIQDMKRQISQLEADLHNMPEEKKRLEKESKQLEKDIKNLESNRDGQIQYYEQQVEQLKEKAKKQIAQLEKQREKTEQLHVELEVLRSELAAQEGKDQQSGEGGEKLAAEVAQLQAVLEELRSCHEDTSKKLDAMRAEVAQTNESLSSLATELTQNKQKKEEMELEQKRLSHKVQQLQKDDQEAHVYAAKMEKQHPWIEKEKNLFGKKGTDFDFQANNYQDNKGRLDEISSQQNKLSKSINKKAMAMFDKAEQEYKDLLQKRDIIINDKCKIEKVIKDLDEKKIETLRRTWMKVNKDFDSIFKTLLPNTNAKLEAPAGMSETEGLEIKVAFNGVWKASLTELSGGQRSLLALSLVLALLLFKPAPMYILDEIDSALDLSHTQNIGHMIRTHFPHSQFIIVSLKEGMFNHANVLFRTRFIDGTSTVTRYAIRDADDRESEANAKGAKRRKLA